MEGFSFVCLWFLLFDIIGTLVLVFSFLTLGRPCASLMGHAGDILPSVDFGYLVISRYFYCWGM